jgi:hypothetical protein
MKEWDMRTGSERPFECTQEECMHKFCMKAKPDRIITYISCIQRMYN